MDTRLDLTSLCPIGGTWVELGVAKGDYAACVLQARPDLCYVGVDAWQDHHEADEAVARRRLSGMAHEVILWKMRFDEAFPMLPMDWADVIYVDGYAHTGQENGETLEQAWLRVRPGGYLAGHDYDKRYLPTIEQVDKLARRYGLGVHLTGEDRLKSWYVRKPLVWDVADLLRGKRIAVVGNGPSLLGKGMGGWIDGADVVVRMNCYQTRGYEQDVGRRCDLWATTGPNQIPGPHEAQPPMAMLVHDKAKLPFTPDRVWRMTRSFYNQMRRRVQDLSQRDEQGVKHLLCSTGTATLAWLLEVVGVKRLLVAGMDGFDKSNRMEHHYWDKRAFRQPVEHDGAAEKLLWKQWGDQLEFITK